MAESMFVALIRQTAEARRYALMYGQSISVASDRGREEAAANLTAEDVFDAIDIVFSPAPSTDSRRDEG